MSALLSRASAPRSLIFDVCLLFVHFVTRLVHHLASPCLFVYSIVQYLISLDLNTKCLSLGGNSDVRKLHKAGDLEPLLKQSGAL